MAIPPRTIDGYLAAVREEQRPALERLRKLVHAAAPGAEECISYRLPTFRFEGRMLVAIGAAARHLAFYPLSSTTVQTHREALAGFETSRATIRFAPDHPLPAALVRKLVKARIAENRAAGRG
jgi:uncharacterized protein YdhG (YjbR/CyaY superfamily)